MSQPIELAAAGEPARTRSHDHDPPLPRHPHGRRRLIRQRLSCAGARARTGEPEGAAGDGGGRAQAAVAVVSWNTRELLERCLHSLAEDARSGRAEVWVVDNASEDGSPEMVRESFGWVRLIASAENVGF